MAEPRKKIAQYIQETEGMRLLTLIRHARASWDDPERGDHARPLSTHGKREAAEMTQRLSSALVRPLQLVSSPAVRALSTAQLFAATLAVNIDDIRIEPRIYEATPGTLLDVINHLDDRGGHVVLFGHNPGFSELAQLLADAPFREMPTCAVLTLRFKVAAWHDVIPGTGEIVRFHFPEAGVTA